MTADQRARQRALHPATSFIVQAPAGSGKTSLLTQRFLRLLALAREPEEILAITFTRKAAAEMRTRILRELRAAKEGAPVEREYERQTRELARAALARDAELDWEILAAPRRLRIQTIDSFEASLLARLPWFSKFGFTPDSTKDAQPLYLEAASRALETMAGSKRRDSTVRLLLLFDNHFDRATAALAALLERRDEWLPALGGVPMQGRDPAAMRREFEASIRLMVEPSIKALAEMAPTRTGLELAALATYSAENLAAEGKGPAAWKQLSGWPPGDADALSQWRAAADFLLTQKGEWRSRKGLSKTHGFPPNGAGEKERMGDLLEMLEVLPDFREALSTVRGLPEPWYTEGQWRILEALLEFLGAAMPELWLQFAARRETDFKEISLRTASALEEAPGVPSLLAERMDAAIQHILVDEFQDTSVLQMLLLKRLTENWSAGDGRTLFLVGDPMQSIYAWRNARVGLFLGAWQGSLPGLPLLETLRLTRNFRSRRTLIEAFNQEFVNHFPTVDDAEVGAVRYVEAEPDAEEADEDGKRIECHAFLSAGPEHEAAWIADEILRLKSEDTERKMPRKIAVLFRTKRNADAVGAALRERGIAFQAVDVDPLAGLPVVQDLLVLLRALLSTQDRLSWLSVLRAPWNGLRLGDLEALHDRAGRGSLWDALCAAAVADSGDFDRDALSRIRRTAALFEEALRWRGRLPLKDLLRMIWLNSGAESYHGNARSRLAAAQFFQVLGSQDEADLYSGGPSLGEALSRLHAPPDPDAPDTLQLLTIHKAKGLEFDVVFLPYLNQGRPNDETPALAWEEVPVPEEGGPRDFVLAIAPRAAVGEAPSRIGAYLAARKRARGDAEVIRVLYVAFTRAKERLHLLASINPENCTSADELKAKRGSYLGTLRTRFEQPFREAWARYQDDLTTAAVPAAPPYPMLRRVGQAFLPEMPGAAPSETASATGDTDRFYKPRGVFETVDTAAGTVFHRMMERIGGAQGWTRAQAMAARLRPLVLEELRAMLPAEADLNRVAERVIRGFERTVNSEAARRYFAASNHEVRGEQSIGYVEDGQWRIARIDRMFRDEAGALRVVDFKLVDSPAKDEVMFLAAQRAKYATQMERYARLLQMQDAAPEAVTVTLYYPLQDLEDTWTVAPRVQSA